MVLKVSLLSMTLDFMLLVPSNETICTSVITDL